MSETVDEKKDDKDKKDKSKKNGSVVDAAPPGDLTEPVPVDKGLFEWLEDLFKDSTDWPEKIDCIVVSGTKYEKFGPMIGQRMFEPKERPSRDILIRFVNKITNQMQVDCDVQRKSVVYGLHAWHFTRNSEPYARYITRKNPGTKYAKQGDAREDEEELTVQDRFNLQVFDQQHRMFGLYGAGYEGMIDRYERQAQRQEERIEKQDARIEKLTDMLERALSLEHERNRDRAWDEIKLKSAEKAIETGMAFVPPIMNRLLGSQVLPSNETPETITIKQFLERLPEDKVVAIMGIYPDDGKPAQPGILTRMQADILGYVAVGRISADELNKLMPGGEHAITGEQIQKIMQAGVSIEQLAPLHMVFEARQNRNKSRS